MTSHGSRSTQSMTAGDRSSGSSEQSDLKKLKSKYGSQLSTLRELFTDWSDDDLLFAIQEADGDLELAVDRISEGHVSQWGEVKSKKSKKEAAAQKAKAAAATTTPAPAQNTHRSERPQSYRGNNDRSRRGGRGGGHGSRGGPRQSNNHTGPHVQAATWGTAPPTTTSFKADGDSWASIASSKVNADDSWAATNNNTTTTTTEAAGGWDAPVNTSSGWDSTGPEPEAETKPAPTAPAASQPTSSEPPKTWASLLKTQPKAEPEPQKQEPESTEKSGWDASKDSWNEPAAAVQNEEPAKDGWEEPAKDSWEEPAAAKDAWNEPATDEWNAPAATTAANDLWEEPSAKPAAADETEIKETEKPAENEPTDNEPEAQEETVTRKTSTTRRLKQDAPVVLPTNNSASLSSIGVKFGSLNLDDNTAETVEIAKTTLQTENSREQEEVISESQERYGDAFGSAPLKQQPQQQQPQQPQQPQQEVAQQAQPQQAHVQQQPQQPQQQQQQQLFGMDQLASGYSSYLPNQHPGSLSGFGVSPMGSLPEYGIYGTEAHRAAAMGYYDPATYSQSPSATSAGTYQGRDKHNQDGVASVPQHSGAQTPGAAQQMYPANMPYYPYYYMPNQFGYQQSAYGQPFLNKNMYPNMYQHSVGKPNTGSTASPYGASGSPYSQNMYGQSSASGYDDVAGLQHHLGGMGGLHDYQKPYQQQLPGFLGNQQPQQAQQQQQAPNQQQTGKADVNKTASNTAGPSNGHQQQPQQQPYQQAMNPGNYFGGHSFPYQQQYPQQHFPHFQQQPGQQQQAPSAQQPSPMGRQQPYWSQ